MRPFTSERFTPRPPSEPSALARALATRAHGGAAATVLLASSSSSSSRSSVDIRARLCRCHRPRRRRRARRSRSLDDARRRQAAVKRSEQLTTSSSTYSPARLVEALHRHGWSDEGGAFNWRGLGGAVAVVFRTPPEMNFLCGAVDKPEKEKKARAARKEKAADDDVTETQFEEIKEDDEKEEEATNHRAEEMDKVRARRRPRGGRWRATERWLRRDERAVLLVERLSLAPSRQPSVARSALAGTQARARSLSLPLSLDISPSSPPGAVSPSLRVLARGALRSWPSAWPRRRRRTATRPGRLALKCCRRSSTRRASTR